MNSVTLDQKAPSSAYKGIFEQFLDDASFLWILRSIAVEQPHYSQLDIQQLERRIDAQLDGLMTSIEQSWPICLEALALNESGETFSAAVLAFRSHDVKKIQAVVEASLVSEDTEKAFISALAWLPAKLVKIWIEKFLNSKDLNHKYLAVAACSVRRENPGDAINRILQRDDCKQHEKLYGRTLRLIGELRRQDLMPTLQESAKSEQDTIRFWSNWSAILLGDKAAASNLQGFVLKPDIYQGKAIDLCFRVLSVEQGRQWVAKLAETKTQPRAVIKATGILGDPHAVNWLISQMNVPASARLAGEAFSNITGIGLEQNQLTSETPQYLPEQPNDDNADVDVNLDEDENLLWPDPDKVKTIWINHGRNFIAGQRYFMGRNISIELLKDKIVNANQRQRHAAALELALIDSTSALQNTRAKVVI